MKKRETSPVRGKIKVNCVNSMPLLRSSLDLSNLFYMHTAPMELNQEGPSYQSASIHLNSKRAGYHFVRLCTVCPDNLCFAVQPLDRIFRIAASL